MQHAKLLQSCLTLWDPMDCSLPVPSGHGILWAGILEWVTISFSKETGWGGEDSCLTKSKKEVNNLMRGNWDAAEALEPWEPGTGKLPEFSPPFGTSASLRRPSSVSV